MEDLTHIQVFKTNIRTPEDKAVLKLILDTHPEVEEWSVDCEDIDCVLRIVSHKLSIGSIITLVSENGYYCEELK